MNRTLPLALALLAMGAASARAQTPAGPDVSKQLIGTWEGPYQSESVPPGTLKLSIAKGEKQEWKVTMVVISDDPPPAGEVKDFVVDGGTVSWTQDIADMVCASKATLVAGVLKGTAECSQGGAVVVTATFLLGKQP